MVTSGAQTGPMHSTVIQTVCQTVSLDAHDKLFYICAYINVLH